MRREFINYPLDLPIKISYFNIRNYPIHWHNSIEIIYVIKGSIDITIDSDSFTLNEKEVEIKTFLINMAAARGIIPQSWAARHIFWIKKAPQRKL